MLMAAEKPSETGPRELIGAEEFDALTDKVLKHDKLCPCRHCSRMDDLINAMCIEPGCHNALAPNSWGCENHPHHVPKTAKPDAPH